MPTILENARKMIIAKATSKRRSPRSLGARLAAAPDDSARMALGSGALRERLARADTDRVTAAVADLVRSGGGAVRHAAVPVILSERLAGVLALDPRGQPIARLEPVDAFLQAIGVARVDEHELARRLRRELESTGGRPPGCAT